MANKIAREDAMDHRPIWQVRVVELKEKSKLKWKKVAETLEQEGYRDQSGEPRKAHSLSGNYNAIKEAARKTIAAGKDKEPSRTPVKHQAQASVTQPDTPKHMYVTQANTDNTDDKTVDTEPAPSEQVSEPATQSVTVTQIDERLMTTLSEVAAWWEARKKKGEDMDTEVMTEGLRPDFDRLKTTTRSVRLDERLWKMIDALAKTRQYRSVAGGSVNGVLELLAWRACGCPEELVKADNVTVQDPSIKPA